MGSSPADVAFRAAYAGSTGAMEGGTGRPAKDGPSTRVTRVSGHA
ncbi:MAG: hypothetical protein ACWA47_09765 [Brevirhabdus sp.]